VPTPVVCHLNSSGITKRGQQAIGAGAPGVVIIDTHATLAAVRQLLTLALRHQHRRRLSAILLIPLEAATIAAMRAVFHEVLTAEEFTFLPVDDLLSALRSPDPGTRAIGVAFSRKLGLVTVVTGAMQRLVVPVGQILEQRKPSQAGEQAIIGGGGRTIAFGKRTVTIEAIRKAQDPLYRREVRRQARATDTSFGACLRRARLSRGLDQGGLGTSDRSIRSIEAGITAEKAIRRKTRKQIEKALRMTFEKVKTY